MKILGISCYYHDAAAALVVDGEVVAAASEERFSRDKHDTGFPHQAIRACLDRAGLMASDLDQAVFYEKPLVKLDRILTSQFRNYPRSLKSFLRAAPVWMKSRLRIEEAVHESVHQGLPVLFTEHHAAHAASSFFSSPFERAALLTVDGVGEWCTTAFGVGDGSQVRLDREIHFPHSLGLFYGAATDYLGFRVNSDEGKVMALAAFAEPTLVGALEKLLVVEEDGSFRFDMSYFGHERDPAVLFEDRVAELVGFPRRLRDEPLLDCHYDLAASAQCLLERALERMLRFVKRETGADNVCLSGGVATNSVANGRLLDVSGFKRIHVSPAPGDDGGALGAALFAWHALNDGERVVRGPLSPYLGPELDPWEVRRATRLLGAEAVELDERELLARAARSLHNERIVGWFQGAMEFGPRALGNRSILASPRRDETKHRLNLHVKRREAFRPFAPAVLAEHASDYFEAPCASPYMSFVRRVRTEHLKRIPAVLHIDGTARLQTVEREHNPLFHQLISEFHRTSGMPMVLNTSFNLAGQPIACSPKDAVLMAKEANLDELFLGSWWLPLRQLDGSGKRRSGSSQRPRSTREVISD